MISNVIGGDISLALWAGIVITPAALWWLSRPRRCSDSSTDFSSFLKKRPDRAAPTSSALAPARAPTSFNSFLKQAPPRHIPTKFSSFLKSVSQAGNGVPAPDAAEEGDLASAPPDAARVAVLFGTEYGFSQDIAEKTCDKLKSTGKLWPVLLDMGDCQAGYEALRQEQAVLMVCSTQGDGVPPTEARGFCDWLAGLPEGSLASVNFSVCALGDSSYAHFCACGKALDANLERCGGHRVERRADIDREDWAAVNQWVHRVAEALLQLPLQSISEAQGAGATVLIQVAASGPKGKAGGSVWGRQTPFMGEVLAVEPLCCVSSAGDKNTVRLAVSLHGSGAAYTAGDALGIWPRNHPEHAEQLIRALRLDGEQPVRLPARAPRLRDGATAPKAVAPLREALACFYDLRSPKPDIFPLLQRLRPRDTGQDPATNQTTAALALEEMIASPAKAAEYLEPRHVLDVFQDHPWAAPSAGQLVEALRPLQPRLYSLSSSPLEDGGQVAQATIAVVEYESLGRQRLGVCSTYIQQRTPVGTHIPVYIHPNPDFRLPEDATRPLIMIGPGTGVAPFRAFILERLAQRQADPTAGHAVLYFGCRRSDQDFLYGEWLTQLAQQGDLTLHTAFSRMQDRKVYVQDRLRDTGPQVWQLLQEGAHVYVCGDASSMAVAVEEALLDIVAENLPGGSRQLAEEYLAYLRAESRYQRDIW